MPAHDLLNGLGDELRALPARDRRAILNVLSPMERSRVRALLKAAPVQPPSVDRKPALEDAFEGYSTLIASRLESVNRDSPQTDKRWKMTPVARRHLAVMAQDLQNAGQAEAEPVEPRGRSLFTVLGSWLARGAAVR